MSNQRTFRVCDFFCGAGGFSEGFRQKGFKVVFALDIWKDAVDTHALNHPDCMHSQMDIRELDAPEKIDDVVPDTEIIVGSPPCVAFSYANRGGKVDKKEGKSLVEAFLRIVAWKKRKGVLKYWAMENVVGLRKHLKERYTFKELGLPGGDSIALETRGGVYNSADYGAPQNRIRFVCGEYPEPAKKGKMLTLGDVIGSLKGELPTVQDPVYGFQMPTSLLTDHFYDTALPSFKWREAKRLKEDSGFYGKMSFPDQMSRPSRTVMALNATPSREAIVLSDGRPGSYRTPTIRELATIMGFPINYQFQADSIAGKHRLVGNSVCPPLSAAIAESILRMEGLPNEHFIKQEPNLKKLRVNLNELAPKKMALRDRRPHARFARHINYLKYGSFRVELDNKESNFSKGRIVWSAKLHHSSGRTQMKYITATLDQIESMLARHDDKVRVEKYIRNVKKTFDGNIPEAKIFQDQYCRARKDKSSFSPEKSLASIKELLDSHFPRRKFGGSMIDVKCSGKGRDASMHGKSLDCMKIPIQFIAGLYACQYIANSTKN